MNNSASRRRPPAAQDEARRRALADWRGIDLSELEGAFRSDTHDMSSVLAATLKSLGLEQRRSAAEVFKAWNDLIDPTVTAHAQPAGLVRGTLFVAVDSDVWKDEIVRYRRREILKNLQHTFGTETIQRISFRVGV